MKGQATTTYFDIYYITLIYYVHRIEDLLKIRTNSFVFWSKKLEIKDLISEIFSNYPLFLLVGRKRLKLLSFLVFDPKLLFLIHFGLTLSNSVFLFLCSVLLYKKFFLMHLILNEFWNKIKHVFELNENIFNNYPL